MPPMRIDQIFAANLNPPQAPPDTGPPHDTPPLPPRLASKKHQPQTDTLAGPPRKKTLTYTEQQRKLLDRAMDRFDVINFADLSGPNGGQWVRIGGGSFGVVFKGEYLGTPVAIKEVLPNNTYDVEKYFERECVLMKEARHPNIVQYIGLTKSPGPDGRIYIISEFVGGNVRSYIADTNKPFPWRLRISFAMDIARAVAYLHARNCMHRDLKGENLLITANDRIKVCDFGFARIAARNEDEMRRISYCGTDGYMSPEILMGVDFSLPSDIFSLGVIFCEIASRHLVDATTFKRQMPEFGLDADEVREMVSPGCPDRLVQLCLDCVEVDPANRPDMREVIKRLRDIEMEIISRDERENKGTLRCVGSVKGSSVRAVMGSRAGGAKKSARPVPPRLPSFNGQVNLPSHHEEKETESPGRSGSDSGSSSASSDEEDLEAALAQLETVKITEPSLAKATANGGTYKASGYGNPWWSEDDSQTLLSIRNSWRARSKEALTSVSNLASRATPTASTATSTARCLQQLEGPTPGGAAAEYSTSVVRPSKLNGERKSVMPGTEGEEGSTMTIKTVKPTSKEAESPPTPEQEAKSYMTARSSLPANGQHVQDRSLAVATIASSIASPAPLYHRFTLVKNGTRRPSLSKIKLLAGTDAPVVSSGAASPPAGAGSLLPPAIMLAQALAKCQVCNRRIGWKPFLDCDDCPYKCHVGCGELAEPTCQEFLLPGEGETSGSSSPGAECHRGSNVPIVTAYNAERRSSNASNDEAKRNGGAPVPAADKDKTNLGGAAARLKRWSKSPPVLNA